MNKRLYAYLAVVAVVILAVAYSVVLSEGTKERHMEHFVIAAMIIPTFTALLSRRRILQDMVFNVVCILALVGIAMVFWGIMDGRTEGCFSFENDLMPSYMVLWFLIAAVVSNGIKMVLMKRRSSKALNPTAESAASGSN